MYLVTVHHWGRLLVMRVWSAPPVLLRGTFTSTTPAASVLLPHQLKYSKYMYSSTVLEAVVALSEFAFCIIRSADVVLCPQLGGGFITETVLIPKKDLDLITVVRTVGLHHIQNWVVHQGHDCKQEVEKQFVYLSVRKTSHCFYHFLF